MIKDTEFNDLVAQGLVKHLHATFRSHAQSIRRMHGILSPCRDDARDLERYAEERRLTDSEFEMAVQFWNDGMTAADAAEMAAHVSKAAVR
jgi:hypothetical protein